MKTIRDILLERHHTAEAKLDALRRETVTQLAERRAEVSIVGKQTASLVGRFSWQDFLLSLRWHFAGLGTAWLAVLLLNIDRAAEPTSAKVAAHSLSARQFMAAVQENRRQVRELSSPSVVESTPPVTGPRSSLQELQFYLL